MIVRLLVHVLSENYRRLLLLVLFSTIVLGYVGVLLAISEIEYRRMYTSYAGAGADLLFLGESVYKRLESMPILLTVSYHEVREALAACFEENGYPARIAATRLFTAEGLGRTVTVVDSILLLNLTPYRVVEGRIPESTYEAVAPAITSTMGVARLGEYIDVGGVRVRVVGLYLYEQGYSVVVDASLLRGYEELFDDAGPWYFWVDTGSTPPPRDVVSRVADCISLRLFGAPGLVGPDAFISLRSLAEDGLRRFQAMYSVGTIHFLFNAAAVVVFLAYTAKILVDVVSSSTRYLALMMLHGATYSVAIAVTALEAGVILAVAVLLADLASAHVLTALYPSVALSPYTLASWLAPTFLSLALAAYAVVMMATTLYILRADLGTPLKRAGP